MKNKAIEEFLNQEEQEVEDLKVKESKGKRKKVLISKDMSIVERIDKQMITEDGRQLLIG